MRNWTDHIKRAEEMLRDKAKLLPIISEASIKLNHCREILQEKRNRLMALIRLVKAWLNGQYQNIPWRSITFAAAAVIYFVNPFDLIPDALPVIGYIDDAAVISYAIAAIGEDLDDFIAWEAA